MTGHTLSPPASPVRADVVGMHVFPLGDDSRSVSVRIRNAGDRKIGRIRFQWPVPASASPQLAQQYRR
jgi:hypothetical protein